MSKAVKAALLSGLVFPGIGHFYLKRHVPGAVLAVAATGSLYVLVSRALERAQVIADKIASGEVPLDVEAITNLVTAPSTGAAAQVINIATAVLLISWLVGIVDSFRVGYLQDKRKAPVE
jgi:hypothetical protein